MKKFVVTIIVVLMVIGMVTVANANEDPIWENVYDYWKDLYNDEYNKFLKTDYSSEGFVDNGVAYFAADNCSLYYDEYHSLEEIKEYANKCCENAGLENYECNVRVIGSDSVGRFVIETIISSTQDMAKVKGCNMHFDEPVYQCKMISWDRICVPTEER